VFILSRERHADDSYGSEEKLIAETSSERLAPWWEPPPAYPPYCWQFRSLTEDEVFYIHYELVRTYVGAVADVEVNRGSGEIRVIRFSIVHDCRRIINLEVVKFNRSIMTSRDWATCPILTFINLRRQRPLSPNYDGRTH
jgi:hypothetical protein